MPLSSFNVNDTIARALYNPETPENKVIRSQLELSDHWKVLGKTKTQSFEFSDDFPDIPLLERDNGGYLGNTVIHVVWNRDDHCTCPQCGHKCNILSYETRHYRHLDDMGYRCFIHVELPKYDCTCGNPQQRFPIAHPMVKYTRRFEMKVMSLLREETRSAVARSLDVSRDIVSGILHRVIRRAIPEQDLSHVSGVYVDETQFGHGQDYISVFLDQHHKVIFACEGHGQDVLDLFLKHLTVQGGNPEDVRFFSADMSRAYESGIMKMFPNATLVWDRFHLMKSVNEALNDIRKGILRRGPGEPLKLIKYTLLHRRSKMGRKHIERLRNIRMAAPDLALAFDMKEAFAEIIKVPDPTAMTRALKIWIEWVMLDGHELLKKKAELFLGKMDRIISWTRYPISNSVSEGVNKEIQDIRRDACGYRNRQNFFDMIFLRLGSLELTF